MRRCAMNWVDARETELDDVFDQRVLDTYFDGGIEKADEIEIELPTYASCPVKHLTNNE